jgi:hypothetical protein
MEIHILVIDFVLPQNKVFFFFQLFNFEESVSWLCIFLFSGVFFKLKKYLQSGKEVKVMCTEIQIMLMVHVRCFFPCCSCC